MIRSGIEKDDTSVFLVWAQKPSSNPPVAPLRTAPQRTLSVSKMEFDLSIQIGHTAVMVKPDVLILGAGAAGLTAAYELEKSGVTTLIIEARKRIGGRVHSLQDTVSVQAIELGAEFVHGSAKMTQQLARRLAIQINDVKTEFLQVQNGQFTPSSFTETSEVITELVEAEDPPNGTLDQWLADRHPSGEKAFVRYIENFHAADLKQMGTRELIIEEKDKGENHRLETGYSDLFSAYFEACPTLRERIHFGRRATRISWSKTGVEVLVQTATGSDLYCADKLICTVPLSVLKFGHLVFEPQLPNRDAHYTQIHMGSALRLNVTLPTDFCSQVVEMDRTFLRLPDAQWFGVWWTRPIFNQRLWVGWVGGPQAQKLSHESDSQICTHGLRDLAQALNIDVNQLQRSVSRWYLHNWQSDPYSLGAYSYLGPQGEAAVKKYFAPVEQVIYFAGEATVLGAGRGTVEAALRTGQRAAQMLLKPELTLETYPS